MKIILETLGMPILSHLTGKKSEINLNGTSVNDVITHLADQYGHDARNILLDAKGRLIGSIQVMVNDGDLLSRESLSAPLLKEGDRVQLLLLAGGG
jgi:hypothetical protein